MRCFRFFSLPAFALLLVAGLSARAGVPETDHLACLKVQDTPPVDGSIPVAISDILEDSFTECRVKKAKLVSLCIRVAKDDDDDPRAGQSAAEGYGCYKVKCAEKPDGSVNVDDQFGSRLVTRKALLTLCTPVEMPPVVP
jgi:hypothetical protein